MQVPWERISPRMPPPLDTYGLAGTSEDACIVFERCVTDEYVYLCGAFCVDCRREQDGQVPPWGVADPKHVQLLVHQAQHGEQGGACSTGLTTTYVMMYRSSRLLDYFIHKTCW